MYKGRGMRIIFITGQYPPQIKGGGEISTHLIAQGLVEGGHEVRVIAEGGQAEESIYEGIKVRRDKFGLTAKPLLEKRMSKRISVRLKGAVGEITSTGGQGQPWIIHGHDFRSIMAIAEAGFDNAAATIRDYAFVCGTTHNILADGSRCQCTLNDVFKTQRVREVGKLRGLARAWQYWHNLSYRKKVLGKIPRQVYISRAQKMEIGEQIDLEVNESSVIFNPLPDEFLKSEIKSGINGEVLYVGRVEDYKGAGLLLEAWQEVVKRVPQAQLRIIGEGAQKEEYERWVAKRGLNYSVKFDGFVPWPRIRNEYDRASVVVAPHRWTEPFGRTVAEGMARGKVVVAADAGGARELIRNNRIGMLFKRDSKEALSEQLVVSLTLGKEKATGMGAAARRWVRENLNRKNIASQYEEFYRRAEMS